MFYVSFDESLKLVFVLESEEFMKINSRAQIFKGMYWTYLDYIFYFLLLL